MKYAADFRKIAREALYGKWKIVILVSFIALLLGGAGTEGLNIELELEDTWAKAIIEFAGITVGSFGGGHSSAIGSFLFSHAKTSAIFVIVSDIFHIVVGGIIEIGYSRFHLNLIDKKETPLKDLFQHFYLWKTVFVANILQTLYVTIGFLLFIIPGIIAALDYSMTSYILAEHPEIKAREALKKSKEIMKGKPLQIFS